MLPMRPYISVVIPALNEGQTLPACLESISSQKTTYAFEVIVADNNSTDDTADISRQYGVRVATAKTAGVCHARNAGLQAAQGDIIVSTDADCTYDEGWIQTIGQAFEQQPDISLLVGNYRFTDAPGWANSCVTAYEWLSLQLHNAFGMNTYVSAANLAFRKHHFTAYNTALTQGGDELYVLQKLKHKGRVLYRFTTPVRTSGRRLQQGFVKTFFNDFLSCYIFNYARTLRTGTNKAGTYAAHRNDTVSKLATKAPIRDWAALLIVLICAVVLTYLVVWIIWQVITFSLAAAAGYIALMLGLAAYACFAPHSQLAGPQPYRSRTKRRVVALTFDDGPNGKFTRDIADYISSYGGQATFFQVGENVRREPDVTRFLYDQGHLIGNHSERHRFADYFKSGWRRNIENTNAAIEAACGEQPKFVRMPWLFRLPWLLAPLYRMGLQPVAGTFLDLQEFRQPDGVAMAVRRADKVKPGDILIMHDGYNAEGGDRRETVRAVAELCRRLDARGFTFVRIDQLL